MVACTAKTPGKTENVQARKLNDSATVIWFRVKGLIYPKDSLKRSISLFKEAIHQDSSYRLAYHNLWNCLNDVGDYAQSEAVCTEWIDKHPDDTDFIIKRGILMEVLGREQQAEIDYNKVMHAVRKDPLPEIDQRLSPEDIQKAIARAYNLIILTKDKDEALKIMAELKKSFPGNSQVEAMNEKIRHLDRKEYLNGLVGYNN